MGDNDVRFELIEGDVDPGLQDRRRPVDTDLEEPPVAPALSAEHLARTLRRIQRRRERLRAN